MQKKLILVDFDITVSDSLPLLCNWVFIDVEPLTEEPFVRKCYRVLCFCIGTIINKLVQQLRPVIEGMSNNDTGLRPYGRRAVAPMALPSGYERLPRKYLCGVVPSIVRNISMKALTLS